MFYKGGHKQIKKKIKIGITFFLIYGVTWMYINLETNFQENVILSLENNVSIKSDNNAIVDELKNHYQNDDIKAVIHILNTSFSKPVVQTNNNDYYLYHLENRSWNYNGSIFIDYRINLNEGKKIIIYGHNSKYIDMPFKILENYMNEEYFKQNPYIELITSNETKLYEIFSVYVETNDWSYMDLSFPGDSWYKHLLMLKSKSLYETNVNVKNDDEILILQTCSTDDKYTNYEHKYLLIILRRIKL